MIDIHSHYLPAIDDGAKAIEESVRMLRMAAEDGITGVVATPHMFIDSFKENTSDQIRTHYTVFMNALHDLSSGGESDLMPLPEVLLGAENFVNERFILNLENGGPILTLNRMAYVLLEFPLFGVFNYFDRLMSALFSRDLIPILAHPERNFQFQRHPLTLHRLVSQGACLQIDSASLVGGFGAEARSLAFYLLKHNLVHFIASDAHGATHRKPLLSHARNLIARLISEQAAQILVEENPARVLRGEEALAVCEDIAIKPRPRSWLSSLFISRR
jgi:protein-tyrosine phosphatase